MADKTWTLTENELREVERGHREMMRMASANSRPIRLSAYSPDLRNEAELLAAQLIDLHGPAIAERYFAGAFRNAEADVIQRMALQPGTTKVINGVQYVLNEHHRWSLPKWKTDHPDVHVAQTNVYNGETRYSAIHRDGTVLATHGSLEEARAAARPTMEYAKNSGQQLVNPRPPRSAPAFHHVNVEADENHDGVTDAARVGVPAFWVPPPPKKIPRIPNLPQEARIAEEKFASRFERHPDLMTSKGLQLFRAAAKPGEPVTFGTDDAKALSSDWNGKKVRADLASRSKNRATLNTALHQTANAITKRAFLAHLDTLPEGSEIMVTVGGCGAGKGFALKNVPEALQYKNRASAVWDSAGDQNATENPWILAEAAKRKLRVSYVYVHADPHVSWAHPERGVVKRAQDPNDGRMVDAKVFADSYALGARNHNAFYEANKNNPNASFVFLENGNPPKLLPGMPQEALSIDRRELANFAIHTVHAHDTIPEHVRNGALQGTQIWQD